MKIIYRISYIIFLLMLIFILNLQCVFSDFALCVGEDGHVDIDVAVAGNQYVTMHHMKEHYQVLSLSTSTVFFLDNSIEHCHDTLISLSSHFFGSNVRKTINYTTIINSFFIFLPTSYTGIVNYEPEYLKRTSDPPPILSHLFNNAPLLI